MMVKRVIVVNIVKVVNLVRVVNIVKVIRTVRKARGGSLFRVVAIDLPGLLFQVVLAVHGVVNLQSTCI